MSNYADGVASIDLSVNVENIKAGGLPDYTALSAEINPFWQQNITPDRKLFINQSKHIKF